MKFSLEDSGLKEGPAKKIHPSSTYSEMEKVFVVSVNSASASERLREVTTILVDSCV